MSANQQTPNPEQVTPDMNNDTNDRDNRRNNNSNRHNRRGNRNRNNTMNNFHGGEPEVGAVIGTKSENRDSDTYQNLIDKTIAYVTKKYKNWRDVIPLLKTLKPVDINKYKPKTLIGDAAKDETEIAIHKEEIKVFVERRRVLESNVGALYSLIWNQCTNGLRAVLKGLDEFETKDADFDTIWLLQKIKLTVSGVEETTSNQYHALQKILRAFYISKQRQTETCDEYLKRFNELVTTVELGGGKALMHPGPFKSELKKIVAGRGGSIKDATGEEIDRAKETAAEAFKAMMFLQNADFKCFGELLLSFKNNALMDMDTYPTTVARAFDILNKYRPSTSTHRADGGRNNGGYEGRSFFQRAD